jgi:hypothetical protein
MVEEDCGQIENFWVIKNISDESIKLEYNGIEVVIMPDTEKMFKRCRLKLKRRILDKIEVYKWNEETKEHDITHELDKYKLEEVNNEETE